jgi:hypothetical protein
MNVLRSNIAYQYRNSCFNNNNNNNNNNTNKNKNSNNDNNNNVFLSNID